MSYYHRKRVIRPLVRRPEGAFRKRTVIPGIDNRVFMEIWSFRLRVIDEGKEENRYIVFIPWLRAFARAATRLARRSIIKEKPVVDGIRVSYTLGV